MSELLESITPYAESLGNIAEDLRRRRDSLELHGGGLRHGTPEWRFSYQHQGLLRIVFVNLDWDTFGEQILSIHVAATNERGHWAARTFAAPTLRGEELQRETFESILNRLVKDASKLADSISENDLKDITREVSVAESTVQILADRIPPEDQILSEEVAREKVAALRAYMFRRRLGSEVWHWCENCSHYPAPQTDYEDAAEPFSGRLCRECDRKAAAGRCRRSPSR